jgi:hypothetical protein
VVSAEVAILTRKVLKTMLLSKLKVLTAILLVVCVLAAGGIGLVSRHAGATGPTIQTTGSPKAKGKRNADGTEIIGEWTKQDRSLRGLEIFAGEEAAVAGGSTKRGRALPLTLRRSDPSKAVAAPPIPGELEGFWQGNWRIGLMDLRLVLKVEMASLNWLPRDRRTSRSSS